MTEPVSHIITWETCGEHFYGWAPPGAISAMDFTIARICNRPKGHDRGHDYCPIYPAGFFPLRENKSERRRRLINEKKQAARAS